MLLGPFPSQASQKSVPSKVRPFSVEPPQGSTKKERTVPVVVVSRIHEIDEFTTQRFVPSQATPKISQLEHRVKEETTVPAVVSS